MYVYQCPHMYIYTYNKIYVLIRQQYRQLCFIDLCPIHYSLCVIESYVYGFSE